MGYCQVCRVEVSSPIEIRFGEPFCSLSHAEEFVEKVRTARIQEAAARTVQVAEPEVQHSEVSAPGAPKQRDWKRYLKMGACCGVPLLALVFLTGGAGAVLGAAGAFLPFLAALACPLGMYFLMRGMWKMERKEPPNDKDEGK